MYSPWSFRFFAVPDWLFSFFDGYVLWNNLLVLLSFWPLIYRTLEILFDNYFHSFVKLTQLVSYWLRVIYALSITLSYRNKFSNILILTFAWIHCWRHLWIFFLLLANLRISAYNKSICYFQYDMFDWYCSALSITMIWFLKSINNKSNSCSLN